MKPRNAIICTLAAALALALAAALASAQTAAAPSAREIMDKVALTRKLAGSEAVVTMTIFNDKGQTRERTLRMATKLYDGGKTEKRIYRFLSPADVQGTSILVFDYEQQSDDVWVYLPALHKTRRIVSSQRAQSFMGSEFSYGDLNVPPLDDYDYQLRGEEAFGGEPCFVIDVAPRSQDIAAAEGYSKKTYWISKARFVMRRGLYYDLAGKLLKELTSQDVALLDPKAQRYRPLRMEMSNKQNGRRSVFVSAKIAFVPDANDDYFTPRYLERP